MDTERFPTALSKEEIEWIDVYCRRLFKSLPGKGYKREYFLAQFFYNRETKDVRLVEVNPRLSGIDDLM